MARFVAIAGKMRIAQVAPLYESCPPQLYGGTERVVSYLTEQLVRQGHEVTLFASGDSETKATLQAPCAQALSGRLVEESNLPVQIAALRRVLGEAPGGDRWIETMPGRGYRFIGPIITETDNGAVAVPPGPEPTPTPRPEAERRQITAMACGLIGISGRADGAGLEDVRDVVGAFQRCVSEVVDRHDGFVSTDSGMPRSLFLATPAHTNTTLSRRSARRSNCARRSGP